MPLFSLCSTYAIVEPGSSASGQPRTGTSAAGFTLGERMPISLCMGVCLPHSSANHLTGEMPRLKSLQFCSWCLWTLNLWDALFWGKYWLLHNERGHVRPIILSSTLNMIPNAIPWSSHTSYKCQPLDIATMNINRLTCMTNQLMSNPETITVVARVTTGLRYE